jgi:hypothetical protein
MDLPGRNIKGICGLNINQPQKGAIPEFCGFEIALAWGVCGSGSEIRWSLKMTTGVDIFY